MMGENICGSYGGGASCTEVCARGIFASCNYVVSLSLSSSSVLTSQVSSSRLSSKICVNVTAAIVTPRTVNSEANAVST